MKTTAEHFEIFKKEVQKWIEYYQLIDWRITILWENDSEGKGRGWSGAKITDKIACVALCKDWGADEITEARLRKTALHEVWEVMLSPLHVIATDRTFDMFNLTREIHTLIRRMENIHFGDFDA